MFMEEAEKAGLQSRPGVCKFIKSEKTMDAIRNDPRLTALSLC